MRRGPDTTDETLVDPDWTPGPETRVVVEEPAPPPRRRVPRLWPWLLALLVLALAGVAAAFYFSRDEEEAAPQTTATAASVEVPLLVGLREPRALEVLREAGLEPGEIERRAGNKPAGVVLEQQPRDGARVDEGETVVLVVSRGPARETVPDVAGEELNQALDDLERAGFESRVRQVFAQEASGVVVRQEPAAGSKLKEGATVSLQVSKGPKPVPVPDVVGQQASEATTVLRDAGFEVNIVPVPSQESAGTVVAQNPAAGTVPEPGTPVRLNVAQEGADQTTTTAPTTTSPSPSTSGPATVPDVVGLEQAQATRALHTVGLRPSFQFVPSAQDPEGVVVAQARAAGTELQRGDSVGVNVSVGPDQVPLVSVPNVEGAREQDARSRLTAAGFRVQVLKERTDDAAEVGVVVDQQPGRTAPEGALIAIYVGRS